MLAFPCHAPRLSLSFAFAICSIGRTMPDGNIDLPLLLVAAPS
jgi:hypothetical protein